MAVATFGRKGIDGAEPVRRRTEFLASAQPPEDEMERRRAAFIASERARAEHAVDVEGESTAASPASGSAAVAGQKSLAVAYVFWAFLGGVSAHRFYLGHPLTGVIQTALWYIGLMFFMAGVGGGIILLAAGGLWILGDALLIPSLHRQANEKSQARANSVFA